MSYVYVLKNKLMTGFCKVGISENVENRISNLYGPWEIVKTWEVDDVFYYETKIKRKMKKFVAHGHELFNCPVNYLTEIVDETIKDCKKETKKENKQKLPEQVILLSSSIKDIGKLIRERRKDLKITQSELAQKCKTGVRFIVDLEKGKPTCEISKSLNIISELGINLYFETYVR